MGKRRRVLNLYQKATVSALKKVARSAEVLANRLIRQEFRLLRAELDTQLSSRAVSVSKLTAKVSAAGPRLALSKFPYQQQSKGVKVTVKRGRGKVIRHSFVVKLPSGHVGVFIRRGEKRRMTQGSYKGKMRQPIMELRTISVAEMFGAKRIQRLVTSHIKAKYPGVFQHELEYYLSKAGYGN